ncbi:MAG: hypothetical protein ACOX8W_06615 [bacterium]
MSGNVGAPYDIKEEEEMWLRLTVRYLSSMIMRINRLEKEMADLKASNQPSLSEQN